MDPKTVATIVLAVAVAVAILMTYMYTVGYLHVADGAQIPYTGILFASNPDDNSLIPYKVFGYNSAFILLILSLAAAAGSTVVLRSSMLL